MDAWGATRFSARGVSSDLEIEELRAGDETM